MTEADVATKPDVDLAACLSWVAADAAKQIELLQAAVTLLRKSFDLQTDGLGSVTDTVFALLRAVADSNQNIVSGIQVVLNEKEKKS